MGRIVHFEIHVDDAERASKFYSNVLGWEFTKWDGPEEYWLIKTGEQEQPGINGGMIKRRDPKGNVYNVANVDNVDEAVKKAIENGGQNVVPKMGVPRVGWLAYCTDTEGNIFGMMQFDPNAK